MTAVVSVAIKLKQTRECRIAFSPVFEAKSIGATQPAAGDTYTLLPIRQAHVFPLRRQRR
jgi:hypothetical protein